MQIPNLLWIRDPAVDEVIKDMDDYYISREGWDTIVELIPSIFTVKCLSTNIYTLAIRR